jgi:adenine-specific DNA-methyltransferase
MNLTDYHAKYFAHELTKRCPSDSAEKLAGALVDAQVDLNPHQVEAALFAFRSPLSKGALLADEVGLGKTIEAGLVISQKWAERKRRILIITPANLRKQWQQEMRDKFGLEFRIVDSNLFADLRKIGSQRVTGHGYAWMTDARGFDPGGSFVSIPDSDQGALGGNRFFTLEKRK